MKLHVPVVTLSTQANVKLLGELKSGFKKNINQNKFKSKVVVHTQNSYLDYQDDQNFQGVKRPRVLLLRK